MVSPRALVGDVHPLLTLTRRRSECAVTFDHRLLEEFLWLLRPHPEPRLVDHRHQCVDVLLPEAAAEVSRGRRIWDSLRSERVEIDFVISAVLDVFETGAAGENVIGDVEDVI